MLCVSIPTLHSPKTIVTNSSLAGKMRKILEDYSLAVHFIILMQGRKLADIDRLAQPKV